jgi:streptomycin 6-kinase
MVTAECAARIVDIHGAAGQRWVDELPGLLAACAERWSLALEEPYGQLSYHYVAPAVRADGSRVVLKAGVPAPSLAREMAALRQFAGAPVVRLVDGDAAMGVMLLEEVRPGTPLSSLGEDEVVIREAVRVMQRLWTPVAPDHGFATVDQWGAELEKLREQFGGGTGPFPPALVARAEQLFARFARETAVPLLLHGDMHPRNILAAEREPWLAIDPKGVVGDPLYDVACLINGVPPLADKRLVRQILARRADLLAELLGVDRRRIHRWGLADAVLAAWWSYEDHGDSWQWAITLAEMHWGLGG